MNRTAYKYNENESMTTALLYQKRCGTFNFYPRSLSSAVVDLYLELSLLNRVIVVHMHQIEVQPSLNWSVFFRISNFNCTALQLLNLNDAISFISYFVFSCKQINNDMHFEEAFGNITNVKIYFLLFVFEKPSMRQSKKKISC